jgi:hypothetical protein
LPSTAKVGFYIHHRKMLFASLLFTVLFALLLVYALTTMDTKKSDLGSCPKLSEMVVVF